MTDEPSQRSRIQRPAIDQSRRHEARRPRRPLGLRHVLEYAIALLLLLVLLALTVRTLSPFISVFMWTVILVVPAAPLVKPLAGMLGGRFTLVAWLIGAAYFLMLVVPLISIGSALDNAMTVAWNIVYRIATEGLPEPPPWLGKLPVVGARLVRAWRSDAHNVAGLLVDAHSTLIVVARVAIVQATDILGAASELVVGIILASLVLAKGPGAGAALGDLALAIGGEAGVAALATARRAILTVALGVVGAALVEAVLATIGFAVAGVPEPTLFGFLVFGFCVFQMGPWLVCLPAALWLWWVQEPGWAIFEAIWGVFVVGGVDFLGRPYIMSRTGQVPTSLLVLGVMGGLVAWGFSGMFIGAASVGVTWTLTRSWVDLELSRRR